MSDRTMVIIKGIIKSKIGRTIIDSLLVTIETMPEEIIPSVPINIDKPIDRPIFFLSSSFTDFTC